MITLRLDQVIAILNQLNEFFELQVMIGMHLKHLKAEIFHHELNGDSM